MPTEILDRDTSEDEIDDDLEQELESIVKGSVVPTASPVSTGELKVKTEKPTASQESQEYTRNKQLYSSQYFKAVTEAVPKLYTDEFKYPKIDVDELTQAKLVSLGLTEAQVADFSRIWASYNAFDNYLFNAERAGEEVDLPITKVDEIVRDQTEMIFGQIESLISYIETYGVEEVKAIVVEFGIRGFNRYRAEDLHAQYVDWESGARPVENIAISAHHDWNGAFASHYQENIEAGLNAKPFYFEVETEKELAQVAVAVGNRERKNGRDPEQGNFVHHIVITGHANPEFIALGDDEKKLEIADYEEAEKGKREHKKRSNK